MRFKTLLGGAIGVAWLLAARDIRGEYATFEGAEITQGQFRIPAHELEDIGESAGDVERLKPVDRFILKETRVRAEIAGVIARVRVEQVFQNPYPERLEAVYVFPLPEDAAVDRYSFVIGDQAIAGVIAKREEARKRYETARDEGRRAGLLEQERANVFTQSVANLPASGEVVVRIEYVHPLRIDGGDYQFRFPMVVAPRYVGGSPLPRPNVGRGWARDTDRVPDASRISPPALRAGERAGNDVFIDLVIDAEMPIASITPVTHEIDVRRDGETRASVSLRNGSAIPDKDFVVEYALGGEQSVIATLTHRAEATRSGYCALVVQPKRGITEAELAPREVILVLDKSGSTRGVPIGQIRVLAQHVVAALHPQDTFRILAFHSSLEEFHGSALPATPDRIASAQAWIRRLDSGAGTEMLPALVEALRHGNRENGRSRHLVLMTDALVGDDDRILSYLNHPRASDVRVFPIAVGAAPNHYLIERAAEIGRGFSMAVTLRDNVAAMAQRFNDKVAAPYLTDLEIDWGGLGVVDVIPEVLPDLYAGEPLVVFGRYDASGRGEVTVRGNLGGRRVETSLELELPDRREEHDSIPSIWARQRIRQLWNRHLGKADPALEDEITRLGLEHHLVTRYTSFVAVETDAASVAQGPTRRELVAVALPEGMGHDAARPGRTPPGTHAVANPAPPAIPRAAPVAARPAPVAKPRPARAAPTRRDPGPRRTHGFGGGGSVEWLYLLCLGLALGGAVISGRTRPLASVDSRPDAS